MGTAVAVWVGVGGSVGVGVAVMTAAGMGVFVGDSVGEAVGGSFMLASDSPVSNSSTLAVGMSVGGTAVKKSGGQLLAKAIAAPVTLVSKMTTMISVMRFLMIYLLGEPLPDKQKPLKTRG